MHSTFHQRGFSLIELLVSLAVLGILLGGGVAMFSSFQERRQAESVALELQRFMVAMRTKARVQESAQCAVGEKLVRFRVEIESIPGNQRALGKPVCAASTENKFEGTVIDDPATTYEYRFSAPVELTESTSPVDFYAVLGGASMPSGGTGSNLPSFSHQFVISKGDAQYAFTVFGSGEISSVQPVTP